MPRAKKSTASNDDETSKKKPALSKSTSNTRKLRSSKGNDDDFVADEPQIVTKKPKLSKEESLFEKYKDETGESVDPFGIERLFNDLAMPPESLEALVLCYKCNAQKMGYITREEFVQGAKSLKASSIAELQKAVKKAMAQFDDPSAFKDLYLYAFKFCKGENKDSRSIETEVAKDMIRCVMGKRYPIAEKFATFLPQSGHKAITLDAWTMFLEFAKKVKPDLSNVNDNDNFWPLIIDEFVEWAQKGSTVAKNSKDEE